MGMDFNIKPANAPVAVADAQPVSAAARQAVATLLPAVAAVTAADPSARPRDGTSRQTVLDRDAATLVHQVVDDRSNLVVRQFPDDALLRRRAYFRAMDLLRDDRLREHAADKTA
ncbi:MAG: hypothetical protein M9932_10775 [Xanthobacteraceae bacterium]|nr:hypothetical protein [Xanthobacteraceae bacterium]